MPVWVFVIIIAIVGFGMYVQGYIDGKKAGAEAFKPTQETWLELEKFKWTHKYASFSNDEEE